MNAEEIVEEICEILCENAEEPAGRGCGYGITEDGQADILAVIKRILPQNRKDRIMSTATVKEQEVFSVTIIERTEVLHETTGALLKINRNVLFDEKVSAVGNIAAQQKAIKKCKATNFDDLEIVCNPFPG